MDTSDRRPRHAPSRPPGQRIALGAVGLAISYIAYRGYRRNQSRPMLFVAAGFVLIVGLPAVVTIVFYVGFGVPVPVVNSLVQACELLGLGAVLYGLWMPTQP